PGPCPALHPLPRVTANIAISPSAPAIDAARICRFLSRLKASGSSPLVSGSSRASFAAVGTLIAAAAIAPRRPAPIISPIQPGTAPCFMYGPARAKPRSEEHTSELQSRGHLVCRLLLEKKNTDLPR